MKCPFLKGKCIPNGCALGVDVTIEGKKQKVCAFMVMAHNIMITAKNSEKK